MTDFDLLSRLAVALAIGLLAGIERGWHTRDEEDHRRAAGFRTFAISGLLGGVAGAISLKTGPVVLGLVFAGYALGLTVFYWLEARATQNLSATSLVAGLLTFALGAYAVVGDLPPAIAAAVAMTVLLALREPLHRWVESLTWAEVRAVLILLAMTFLLLPVLPNRTVDPWDAINPYAIWLLAIMIAGISFVGYVAVRLFGDTLGILVAAAAGGLASSTATTLTLARMGHRKPGSARLISGGILISGTVMVIRIGVIVTIVNAPLLSQIAAPLAAAGLVLLVAAALMVLSAPGQEQPRLEIDNPLQIRFALQLAALIGVITLATRLFGEMSGGAGALVIAAISGIVDVDAVTISMARLGGIGIDIAIMAILVASAVNTLVKAGMALWIGGPGIGIRVGVASLLAILAGAVAYLVT